MLTDVIATTEGMVAFATAATAPFSLAVSCTEEVSVVLSEAATVSGTDSVVDTFVSVADAVPKYF